jgi:hypothetical protein
VYEKLAPLILTRVYYRVKPLMPWGMRIALRRWLARRILPRVADRWPIYEPAGRRPEQFTGWPEGKQFAFVVTHDVESQVGLDRCMSLMDIDASNGFRSSFNFVPAGEYRTPPRLRECLTAQGFELGVHDLRHDGKLYDSRAEFRLHAEEINRYLREWGAVGFRSAFMHSKLDWLHELEIEYDASTFDTDPFEPLPDGVNTIFPFWRAGQAGSGYVELPYTLAQDSTLFLVLQQREISMWRRKLDWVAQHGGMALVNVHPDYMCFDGAPSDNEYPASHYLELLDYVRSNYQGRYWNALPREVAEHTRAALAAA